MNQSCDWSQMRIADLQSTDKEIGCPVMTSQSHGQALPMGLSPDASHGDTHHILFIKISGTGCNEMLPNPKCLSPLCTDYDMDKAQTRTFGWLCNPKCRDSVVWDVQQKADVHVPGQHHRRVVHANDT